MKSSRPSSTTLDLRSTGSRPAGHWARRRRLLIGIVVASLLAAGLTAYFAWPQPKPNKGAMQRTVAAVGRLMVLPEGEEPTYGTVTDKAKLKNQTFFAKAQNGDEVLIYEKAKLTILYRPSIQKIVNVGPVVVGSAGSPYVTAAFAVKNGTNRPELNNIVATRLKQLYPNATIASSEQASRGYPTTITIDLAKKNQPLNQQIADSLQIQAGQAPLGEPAPKADFLIIIGEDYRP